MKKILTRQELIERAREAVASVGSQSNAASMAEIRQSTVSNALNVDPDTATFDATLVRIIEAIEGIRLDRVWQVVE